MKEIYLKPNIKVRTLETQSLLAAVSGGTSSGGDVSTPSDPSKDKSGDAGLSSAKPGLWQ